MCNRADDPTQHDAPRRPRRYIHRDGDPLTHAQAPDDDYRSNFRRTLCDRYIGPREAWSSGPIPSPSHPIDCPDCIALAEEVEA